MTIQKPDPLPDATVPPQIAPGAWHPDWYRWFRFIDRVIRETVDFANTPEPPPAEVGLVEEFSVFIAFPANKDYKLSLDAAEEREVFEVVTICESGTCTVTIKTDATALGGTANSASSTQQIQSHTTSNVWNVDEDLVATISSNSSCVGLTITVKTRRTIVTT